MALNFFAHSQCFTTETGRRKGTAALDLPQCGMGHLELEPHAGSRPTPV